MCDDVLILYILLGIYVYKWIFVIVCWFYVVLELDQDSKHGLTVKHHLANGSPLCGSEIKTYVHSVHMLLRHSSIVYINYMSNLGGDY